MRPDLVVRSRTCSNFLIYPSQARWAKLRLDHLSLSGKQENAANNSGYVSLLSLIVLQLHIQPKHRRIYDGCNSTTQRIKTFLIFGTIQVSYSILVPEAPLAADSKLASAGCGASRIPLLSPPPLLRLDLPAGRRDEKPCLSPKKHRRT